MKNYFNYLTIALLMLVSACAKDENNDNLSGNNSTVKTSVTGRVFDENGNIIVGAVVTAAGKMTTTDVWGIYYLENVNLKKGRDIVRVTYSGKWEQIYGFIPSTSRLNYVNVYMNENPINYFLVGSSGGTITLSNNATVEFPANAFVTLSGTAYTGSVVIKGIQLSPDQPNFTISVPGGDLIGTRLNGTDQLLISYGMVGIKLFDINGSELQLAPGKTAQITSPIVSSQQSAAPASIPLWYLDESTGKWKEEGVAVKSGNTYVGQVSHFTYWNYDDPRPYFTVNGSLIDCQFIPQPNVYVAIHGQQIDQGGHGYSDYNGNFSGNAPASVDLNVFLYGWLNNNLFTTLPPQSPLSIYHFSLPINVSTLPNTNCNTNYTGFIKNCNGQPKIAPVIFLDSLNQYIGHCISDANGAFSYSVPTGQVKIASYSGLFYTSLDTAINQFQITPIGTLYLCDTLNTNNNFQMTFTSPGTGTLPLSFQVSQCTQNFISGESDIQITYVDSSTMLVSDFHIITPLYQNGTYNWNSTNCTISGSIYLGVINYTISPGATGGTTILNNTPLPGGNVSGSFSGPVLLDGGGVTIPGTLSGTFDMYRNN